METTLELRFAPELRFFLAPRHRNGTLHARADSTSTLAHLVQSHGVPMTEVGTLLLDGLPVSPGTIPAPGQTVDVAPPDPPQAVPFPLRFLLDVHLGTLARRLRLLGLDTAYDNDRDDPSLFRQANAEERVLLTRDRGLLSRTGLRAGAHVRHTRPDDQLREVLHGFAPDLDPWTRCPACNGVLVHAEKQQVTGDLEAGTRAAYDAFARCPDCDRVYWPGAHHSHLAQIVRLAQETVCAHRP
ncbi:Mut7-C RNAse domain-containing protein [Nocardiopsis sp. N85]|uniref:Mut7-C RNAse domain-containing protein n=1 Tax=Nocardiopsis sp. N85 TaxID=3029400 RepID=UPI00237F0E7F|nr:Mut7-C RNAse domain-containing protein [Nocardiopsis sp. N85]MDE3722784.1 Mut7-C RNAse domain-containing protein [Nocardiopsis sp. N85]